MMKIKRITLNGFRGILTKQDLNLVNNGNQPTSLVVYGLNSSGKTSFVDGLEWFLSPVNEIEWLKRENAGSHAYPHQEANEGETFVEIEFTDGDFGILTKTFNNKRITIPTLSDELKFDKLYKSFTIRPYLRYLEIIDFVFNRTGVEKYQKLANWMGFEDELAFQEKIALGIVPNLRSEEKKLSNNKEWIESEILRLLQITDINKDTVLKSCNNLIKQINSLELKTIDDLPNFVKNIDKKLTNLNTSKLAIIIKAQTNLQPLKLNNELVKSLKGLEQQINDFNSKKELADKLEHLNLYEKAYELLKKNDVENIKCPVCGDEWNKTNLVEHINSELQLLRTVKESHDVILKTSIEIETAIDNEIERINLIIDQFKSVKDSGIEIDYGCISLYKLTLDELFKSLSGSIFESEIKSTEFDKIFNSTLTDLKTLDDTLENEKSKLQPSKEEVLFSQTLEKLRILNDKLSTRSEIINKANFYSSEISKFVTIGDEFYRLVQEDITNRFTDVSSLIEKYFSILRQDKDIKNIEITLNLEKSRAVGRSAEIQLSYYDLVVKPAYKVLSESLLNSLGLAVYFTCIKKFNTESKFIVLDDIMNSLDMGHRDTLLDLIQQEFSDYQIILFTHDLHWFERIQRRFPQWLHKKIKNWDYMKGPMIDRSKNSLEEINELLDDSTKAHEAGRNFGVYVENSLNDLCEQLHAEVRYRYTRHDPPSTEELFTALCKRLKEKLVKNPIVELAQNAQKYEPLIRNATSHSRQNYNSTISPTEVRRAIEEWLKFENSLLCTSCNRFVEYKKEREQIECRCGQLKLEKLIQ